MQDFSISFSRALSASDAAAALVDRVEADLGGDTEVAGGILLATAAAGAQGPEVGRLLLARWPGAELLGTSFEGIVCDGRVWRDEPALGLLTWRRGERGPAGFAFEPEEQAVERIAHGILDAAEQPSLGPDDLVVLFPDAHGLPPIDPMLASLAGLLGRPTIAGSAASGLSGAAPRCWIGAEDWPRGGLVGFVVPGGHSGSAGDAPPLATTAVGSRLASPWRAVTSASSRWIQRIEGRSALDAMRSELGLSQREIVEPFLGRLLVRLRRGGGANLDSEPKSEEYDEERYMVGLDERRGAFSIPIEAARGDAVAFAWPDALLARDGLRAAVDLLRGSPWLLHFSCRARDAGLYGDADVESAWVAAHATGRRVLGTVAPFQIGPGPGERPDTKLLVHSSVLAALQGH